jgi:hypothetical protein
MPAAVRRMREQEHGYLGAGSNHRATSKAVCTFHDLKPAKRLQGRVGGTTVDEKRGRTQNIEFACEEPARAVGVHGGLGRAATTDGRALYCLDAGGGEKHIPKLVWIAGFKMHLGAP